MPLLASLLVNSTVLTKPMLAPREAQLLDRCRTQHWRYNRQTAPLLVTRMQGIQRSPNMQRATGSIALVSPSLTLNNASIEAKGGRGACPFIGMGGRIVGSATNLLMQAEESVVKVERPTRTTDMEGLAQEALNMMMLIPREDTYSGCTSSWLYCHITTTNWLY